MAVAEEQTQHLKPPPRPSVGRIVHFHPRVINPMPEAAIVMYVHEDGSTVTLTAFTPVGPDVEDAVPFAETPTPGHWSWPPRV